MKLLIMKNSRVLISIMEIAFFKLKPEIPKYEILFENLKFFFLSETLSELNFI